MNNLAVLPINEIRKGEIALRDVDVKDPKFLAMVESVKQNGIISPISVCPVTNAETQESYYVIIDGSHRFSAAQEAGLTDIPCNIIDADEAKILSLQFQGNLMRVETKPAQYGKHIRRIMTLDPTIKLTTLADKFCVSTSYIVQRLQLTSLLPEIQKAVDADQIPLNSAIALSKIPANEQPDWVERGMTMDSGAFVELANARAKSIREAIRAGKNPEQESFVPTPRLRRVSELQDELKNGIVASTASGDPKDAFLSGVRWSLSLDEGTVQKKKEAFEALAKQREEKSKARKEEVAKKKLAKNQEEAEALRKEIESGVEQS